MSRGPYPDRSILRFSIPLPDGVRFTSTGQRLVAVSLDGKRMAHTGNNQLYLREMDATVSAPIRGTETKTTSGARNPFFSPNGQWIGYWAEGKLQKISINGGAPVALCHVNRISGASWTDDDIVFAQGREGVWRVSANGGEPENIVPVDPDARMASGPQLLPGGKAVLFTYASTGSYDDAQIVVQPLPAGEQRILLEGRDVRYTSAGHLVYAIGETLFAIPFDIESLEVAGGPVPVAEGVAGPFSGIGAASHFDVSGSGTLFYVPGQGGVSEELVWLDESGETPFAGRDSDYRFPRVSPDGRRFAFQMRGSEGTDIWIYDLERNTASRLTVGGQATNPAWSPDGEWVAFSAQGRDPSGLYRRRADFSGEAELLVETRDEVSLADWSRDGLWLVYMILDPETGRDVWALPLDADRQPRPILQSRFTESTPALSPDGRWLAYLSNESGSFEVYATSFPEPGRTVQISTDVVGERRNFPGGGDPVWLPDGDSIAYLSFGGARTLLEVDITTEPELRAGTPRPIRDVFYSDYIGRNYDVTPDGKRFLMVHGSPDASQAETIHVVVNWFEELKERVPVE